jgi:hypothetical protein
MPAKFSVRCREISVFPNAGVSNARGANIARLVSRSWRSLKQNSATGDLIDDLELREMVFSMVFSTSHRAKA